MLRALPSGIEQPKDLLKYEARLSADDREKSTNRIIYDLQNVGFKVCFTRIEGMGFRPELVLGTVIYSGFEEINEVIRSVRENKWV